MVARSRKFGTFPILQQTRLCSFDWCAEMDVYKLIPRKKDNLTSMNVAKICILGESLKRYRHEIRTFYN
jgi:hypothetical protein